VGLISWEVPSHLPHLKHAHPLTTFEEFTPSTRLVVVVLLAFQQFLEPLDDKCHFLVVEANRLDMTTLLGSPPSHLLP
jgi:hypothetical protein